MKLTPWYPGHVKPVRVGVYERKFVAGTSYCFWDGVTWYYGAERPWVAEIAKYIGFSSSKQSLPWRGIAKEPK